LVETGGLGGLEIEFAVELDQDESRDKGDDKKGFYSVSPQEHQLFIPLTMDLSSLILMSLFIPMDRVLGLPCCWWTIEYSLMMLPLSSSVASGTVTLYFTSNTAAPRTALRVSRF